MIQCLGPFDIITGILAKFAPDFFYDIKNIMIIIKMTAIFIKMHFYKMNLVSKDVICVCVLWRHVVNCL